MADLFPYLASPFYFVRHGVIDHNLARLVMGQRDILLNGEGRYQTKLVAHVLEGRSICTVVSGPLARACETAEISQLFSGVPVTLESSSMERA